jgi:prefoldin subunit 5
VVHHAEKRCAPHRTSLRRTISVEKIDRFLADIQKQVEDLQRQKTNLRQVRTHLAGCQQEHGGDEEQAPYSHSTFVGMQSDS